MVILLQEQIQHSGHSVFQSVKIKQRSYTNVNCENLASVPILMNYEQNHGLSDSESKLDDFCY